MQAAELEAASFARSSGDEAEIEHDRAEQRCLAGVRKRLGVGIRTARGSRAAERSVSAELLSGRRGPARAVGGSFATRVLGSWTASWTRPRRQRISARGSSASCSIPTPRRISERGGLLAQVLPIPVIAGNRCTKAILGFRERARQLKYSVERQVHVAVAVLISMRVRASASARRRRRSHIPPW
jgi:hypothetical protein